jgi:HAE1 family hydrophobic/amphiphilic exporter-1
MARAVVGGLITSTLLTLIVVPVFYELIDDMSLVKAWNWLRLHLGLNAAVPDGSAVVEEAPDA